MFSRLTRLPLRRCLHTIPPRSTPSYRARYTLGASAAVAATATYFTWRLTSDGHRIALDSVASPTPVQRRSTKPSALQDPAAGLLGLENSLASTEAESPSESPNSDASETNASHEEDASSDSDSGGAFNPVTGEINWDCPCLGGMAHGPCGPQFREAFSCFVFSEEEPKGINCVEKFKAMQTCFREHPEVYGDEIMDDDEDGSAPVPTPTDGVAVLPPTAGDVPEKPVDLASTAIPKSQPRASATH